MLVRRRKTNRGIFGIRGTRPHGWHMFQTISSDLMLQHIGGAYFAWRRISKMGRPRKANKGIFEMSTTRLDKCHMF